MAALVAVPSPGITADSLFQIETYLAAMIETAELVPQEQEEEFRAEFRQTLANAVKHVIGWASSWLISKPKLHSPKQKSIVSGNAKPITNGRSKG
jgi:hypothetical protein